MINNILFNELMGKYLSGSLTEGDARTLGQMLSDKDYGGELNRILTDSFEKSSEGLAWGEKFRDDFVAKLREKMSTSIDEARNEVPLVRPSSWLRYAAAIILIAGMGILVWKSTRMNTVDLAITPVAKPNDILPGKDGALLTLEDGTQIVLDTIQNGVVATQTGSRAEVKDGQLHYTTDRAGGRLAGDHYNTMSTPKGRQFQLVLSDGSRVWLNAGSSIKYPTVFAGSERMVEIDGEAYFEIKKDRSKPFKVQINEATIIEVLGTAFNVNAYENEKTINTTLIEGAIKIRSGPDAQYLKPGQQAQLSAGTQIAIREQVNIPQVMAWKAGYFDFNQVDLMVMMRQLERWYDITVKYEPNIPDIMFKGKMDRNMPLQAVINFLKASGVKVERSGKVLTISK